MEIKWTGRDFTDPGADPDPGWREGGNNVCALLHGSGDATTVAERFVRAGWSARSSSWHGYELETSWCRVELDPAGNGEVLLNGVIDPSCLEEFATVLSRTGLGYTVELYDEAGLLLREISS